jgi:hypothetical protein
MIGESPQPNRDHIRRLRWAYKRINTRARRRRYRPRSKPASEAMMERNRELRRHALERWLTEKQKASVLEANASLPSPSFGFCA